MKLKVFLIFSSILMSFFGVNIAFAETQQSYDLSLKTEGPVPTPVHAPHLSQDVFLSDILIQGNRRTSTAVIQRELNFAGRKTVSKTDIQIGIENIRNTNLFATVEHALVKSDIGTRLEITVQERWTTIPIFKVSSGGDVQEYSLGVYDPNLFGEFIESGVQYQRIGSADSGVVWFKNPRLFGKRQGIDLQYWQTGRVRTKYEQIPDEAVIKSGFLQNREKVFAGYNREFHPTLKGSIFYEYNQDRFSDDFLSEEVQATLTMQPLPSNTQVHFVGLGIDWGRLNFNEFLVDGSLLQASYKYGLAQTEGLADFSNIDVSFQYFRTLGKNVTFAQRLLGGATTTNILQYWYYLGGLDRIRGFSDNRFAGRYFLLSNTEVRVPFFRSPWVVVQGVGFVDIVSAAERFADLDQVSGASMGGGLRLFLPKLYRFVLRLDYAAPIKRTDEKNISFGIQQFF